MRHLPTIALLTVTIVSSMSAQKTPAPSLRETQDWITNTIEHGDNGRGYGVFSTHFPKEDDSSDTDAKVTFNACEMTIASHTRGGAVTVFEDLVQTVNLKDLDPRSIKVTPNSSKFGGLTCYTDNNDCDEATVSFETRDAKLLVRSQFKGVYRDATLNSGPNQQKPYEQMLEHTSILVSEIPYAKKLSHALAHAIELCGGKGSSF